MKISLKNYQKSLSKINKIIDETKHNIVKSVDYQKVVMSWKIGEEIEEHLKQNKGSKYGEKFFVELEKDTKISQRVLYQMQAFHKTYPTLPSPEGKLNWSHYRTLSAVKNQKTRKYLENLAVENDLGAQRLGKAVAKSKARKEARKIPEKKISKKLLVKRGKLFTYTKTEEGEIDLGFHTYLSPQPAVILDAQRRGSREVSGNTPLVTPSNDGVLESLRDSRMTVVGSGAKPEFTYLATLEKIVDGDTIHVKLDLGFGVKHHEILRFAKVSAEEAKTKGGDNSTVELKKILQDVPFLVIRTNKTDTYGRYVADVFFDKKERDPNTVAAEGTYLNQLLLDEGLVTIWK